MVPLQAGEDPGFTPMDSPEDLSGRFAELHASHGELAPPDYYVLEGYFLRHRLIGSELLDSGEGSLLAPEGIALTLLIRTKGPWLDWGNGTVEGHELAHFSFQITEHAEVLDVSVPGVGEFRYLANQQEPVSYLVFRHLGDHADLNDDLGVEPMEPTGGGEAESAWKHVNRFGWYFAPPGTSWIFHVDHGWLYTLSPPDTWQSGFWFYTLSQGWGWSAESLYPWLWIDAASTWQSGNKMILDPQLWYPITNPEVLAGRQFFSLTRYPHPDGENGIVLSPDSLFFDVLDGENVFDWVRGDEVATGSWETSSEGLRVDGALVDVSAAAWNPLAGLLWWRGEKYAADPGD